MSKKILERYRRDEGGKLVIDIAATKVSDLYDDFDKEAPFIRKELDYDLVEYLIESAQELGREPFRINFSFSMGIEPELRMRVRKSIENYFDYLLAKNARELHRMFRTSLILIVLGLGMLSGSVYLNYAFGLHDTLLERILAEGLVIASWVSMWEAIAGLFLNWHPAASERMVYRRLRNAQLSFTRSPELLSSQDASEAQ